MDVNRLTTTRRPRTATHHPIFFNSANLASPSVLEIGFVGFGGVGLGKLDIFDLSFFETFDGKPSLSSSSSSMMALLI